MKKRNHNDAEGDEGKRTQKKQGKNTKKKAGEERKRDWATLPQYRGRTKQENEQASRNIKKKGYLRSDTLSHINWGR